MFATGHNDFRKAMNGVRRQYGKVFVFSLFLNLTVLVVPLYMLQIYDRVLTSQSIDTLYVLTGLAVGLLVAMALVDIARSWLLVQSSNWLDSALNGVLFKLALNKRLQGDETSISQPIRDLETMRSFMTGPGLPAMFDAPWVPLYLAIMYAMHPIFGAIATVGAIVILAIAILSDLTTKNATRQASQAHQTSNGFMETLSRNSDVIHSMGMVENLRDKWLKAHGAGVDWQSLASDRAAVLNAFAKSFRLSLQVAILGTGAWLAIHNVASPGVMIAASIIMSRALAPAEAAIANWRGFIASRQAQRRLADAFAESVGPEQPRLELPPPTGRLEVEKVFLRYPSNHDWLLQDLTFDIAPGQFLGVVGPSGVGKTSLLKVLLGLRKPNLGSVRMDGADFSDWSFEHVGPHIGYVPQDVELLVGTVADNIARFTDADPKEVVAAARLANAHEMILRLRDGYETVLGEGGAKISGGQRQRIALARALYGEPNFIVLDEPNANLDGEGQAALARTLAELKKMKRTVLLVTHRGSVINPVDRLLVLLNSREYLFGEKDAVLNQLNSRSVEQPVKQAVAG